MHGSTERSGLSTPVEGYFRIAGNPPEAELETENVRDAD